MSKRLFPEDLIGQTVLSVKTEGIDEIELKFTDSLVLNIKACSRASWQEEIDQELEIDVVKENDCD